MTDMNKWENISNCPICDGELQATATVQQWYSGTRVSIRKDTRYHSGYDYFLESDGYLEDEQTDDYSIYCENDHSIDEMLSHLFPEGK